MPFFSIGVCWVGELCKVGDEQVFGSYTSIIATESILFIYPDQETQGELELLLFYLVIFLIAHSLLPLVGCVLARYFKGEVGKPRALKNLLNSFMSKNNAHM